MWIVLILPVWWYPFVSIIGSPTSSRTSPFVSAPFCRAVVVVRFSWSHICLSSQLKAASCARCSLRCHRHRRSKSTGTHSQDALWLSIHRSSKGERRCKSTHACCCRVCSEHFSTLYWPRRRSISGSWMVRSRISFGTSTIWSCHRMRQCCWMVSDSSGRLDSAGCF